LNIINTEITDVKILEPTVFEDERGFFFESFNHSKFEHVIGQTVKFVQDNHSKSTKGVLRGLHYQTPPFSQGKLVRVVHGEVFDVAVDIRSNSPSFGKWVGIKLSASNKKQLWIPEGFAHGFLTISDSAEFLYKTTNYYQQQSERCILWDDSSIGISWPETENIHLSNKDRNGMLLKDIKDLCDDPFVGVE
jgi:dTDP-4-dehydrorhamnose 3,5-epimerase